MPFREQPSEVNWKVRPSCIRSLELVIPTVFAARVRWGQRHCTFLSRLVNRILPLVYSFRSRYCVAFIAKLNTLVLYTM